MHGCMDRYMGEYMGQEDGGLTVTNVGREV